MPRGDQMVKTGPKADTGLILRHRSGQVLVVPHGALATSTTGPGLGADAAMDENKERTTPAQMASGQRMDSSFRGFRQAHCYRRRPAAPGLSL